MIRVLSPLLVVVAAALCIGHLPGEARGHGPAKRFEENNVGKIPSSWGDLMAVSGDSPKHTLVFRNEKGEIRIITLVGAALPKKVTLIERYYLEGARSEDATH